MRKIDHPCKQLRQKQSFWSSLKERVDRRLTDHIATCPRCQKRLAGANRVELALTLLKSQPHTANLLARANSQAIGVLQHPLRRAPQSEKLRRLKPEHNWVEQKRPTLERLLSIAACLFVVLLIRMGVTASMLDIQNKGKKVMYNYYARNLDDTQLVNELFPDDTTQA